MKISVIIAAFNEEKRIGATLEAILAQDYPDFEVIVIDNGSIDKTVEIVRSFTRSNDQNQNKTTQNATFMLLSESQKGANAARERGRLEASGDIIVTMDADCLPEKDWLSRGAAHFNDPRVVLISGPYDYYDASPFFRRTSLIFQKYIYVPVNHLLHAFKRGAIALGGNTFIRSATLKKMGGFDISISFHGDDMDTAKRASRHGKTIFDSRLVIKTADPSKARFGEKNLAKKVALYWIYFFKTVLSPKDAAKKE